MRPPWASRVPLPIRFQACRALRPRRILGRSCHSPRLLVPSRSYTRSASAPYNVTGLNRFTVVAACLSHCLRFNVFVTSHAARLVSRWLAGPCRGGNRTLCMDTAYLAHSNVVDWASVITRRECRRLLIRRVVRPGGRWRSGLPRGRGRRGWGAFSARHRAWAGFDELERHRQAGRARA